MKTFEGVFIVRWFKNDSGGDRRGLTIDCKDKKELRSRLANLKFLFLTKGENGKLPFSVTFDMAERT